MKLEMILKKKLEIDANKEKLSREVAELERQLESINAEAEAAAADGLEDKYIELTDEASRINRRIYVKNKSVTAPGSLPEAEVFAAWKEYAAAYEKNFKSKYAEYVKAAKKLYDMYCQLITEQNEALKMRRKCGALVGMEVPPTSINDNAIVGGLKINGLPRLKYNSVECFCVLYGKTYPDTNIPMFIELGFLTEDQAVKYGRILTNTAVNL